ncbi:MAG: hypothetical protein U1A78_08945 [Polyangia bacterium]
MNKPLTAAVAGVAFGSVLTAALLFHLSRPSQRATIGVTSEPAPVVADTVPAAYCAAGSLPEADSRLAADELLRSAELAYARGNYPCALALSRKARRIEPLRAWRLLGDAACSQGDAELADQAFLRLDGPSRQRLLSVCAGRGLVRERGRFRSAD